MTETGDIAQVLESLSQSIEQQSFERLILSRYQWEEDLQRIVIRLILLQETPHLSFVFSHKTKDITKNYTVDKALELLKSLLGESFKQANVLTQTHEIQLSFSKKGKSLYRQKLLTVESKAQQSTEHNRDKYRFISLDRPFLRELGITDQQHRVIPAMSRKWRQINKFIEIVATALKSTGLDQRESLHIADFGSGKAYLSFAVHDYLSNTLG